MATSETNYGPKTKEVPILGNKFILSEPYSDGLAEYLDLQRRVAKKQLTAHQATATLLEKAQADGETSLSSELIEELEQKGKEFRASIQAAEDEVVLFILNSTPSNPVVDITFVQKNLTLTMKQGLIADMDALCGIENKEKNVMSLLFPNLSVLKRSL